MQGSGGPGETEEVAAEPAGRVRRYVGVEEEAAELLACTHDFLAAVTPPAGIVGGQIEQLQGPLESAFEPVLPTGNLNVPEIRDVVSIGRTVTFQSAGT